MTSIRVSFLATMTHLNFPAATCSYNKPFLHPVKVMFSLFQNNFTDSNSLHISLKACVLPHPPASQIWLCQHLSSYSLLCPLFGQYSLLSWLFSPLPPHSSYSMHDILQLKKLVFTTDFDANYGYNLFISTILNILVAEVNTAISLITNYCWLTASGEQWIPWKKHEILFNYSGCEKLFSLFGFVHASSLSWLSIAWFFHCVTGSCCFFSSHKSFLYVFIF